MKKVIVIGFQGQDGYLLSEFLKQKGCIVIGIGRDVVTVSETQYISGLPQKIDICDARQIFHLLQTVQPDEIYHLAAYHHSSQDVVVDNIALFERSYQVNVLSLMNMLEGIRLYSSHTRLFYAASSHIFGCSTSNVQTEETPLAPHTLYGVHKAESVLLSRMYRNNYKIFVSVGILYNHESTLRSEKFVSQKIVKTAVRIKNHQQTILELGDINAIIDWGYAPDYVYAMWLMLQHNMATDCIIATGEPHTVKEFAQAAFEELGLPWEHYVRENPSMITRSAPVLVGDSSKLRSLTGWHPSVKFHQMVKLLVRKEIEKYENE